MQNGVEATGKEEKLGSALKNIKQLEICCYVNSALLAVWRC